MHKILVVDDEAMERTAIKELLERQTEFAADVRTAADGQSAVELAAIWLPDIILLDIEMPGMSGMQAAGRILRAQPACQIIFLTAYGLFQYAQEAIRLGVRDYILKPAEDEEILRAVRLAIARIPASHVASASVSVSAPVSAETAKPHPSTSEKSDKNDKNARLLRQVQSYLEANYQTPISLESLADTLGFSPFYLSKLFKQYFGVSFIEYLTDVRVNAAKDYLTDPTKSIREIGELVGYPNSNYFVKMFKKKTGQTPTEYRNSR
jgi:YesN/AraC family two-component response regulator